MTPSMRSKRPLLVCDTNFLLEVLLEQDGNNASWLLQLAEQGQTELVVPEFVLSQFQGTARRKLREYRGRLAQQVQAVNEWLRSNVLSSEAQLVRKSTHELEKHIAKLQGDIPGLVERLERVARIERQTQEVKLRGELRYIAGRPPARPDGDVSDCCIYEATLEIARAERGQERPKFLVTRDNDFDAPELQAELTSLGFHIRKDLGRLYGELRAAL